MVIFEGRKNVYIIEETWYRLHFINDKKTQISLFTQIKDGAMINVLYQEQIKKTSKCPLYLVTKKSVI